VAVPAGAGHRWGVFDGGKLVSHVPDSGVLCLYATPFGKSLYERLGFHSVGKVIAYSGVHPRAGGGFSRPAEPADRCDLMMRNASDVPGDRSLYHAPVSLAPG
jgi:hypothetical protein